MTRDPTVAALAHPHSYENSSSLPGAAVALAALVVASLPAFLAATKPDLADRVALLFLAVAGAFCAFSPLRALCEERASCAAYWLTAAFFVIYSIARRGGPQEGPALHMAILPEVPLVVPWSAYIVVLGTLLSLALTRPRPSGELQGVLAAAVIIGTIGLGIFKFLGGYYPVGATAIVDPESLVYALLQLVEYAAVALLCNTIAANPTTRRLAVRALPALLVALWARHQFGPHAAEEAD